MNGGWSTRRAASRILAVALLLVILPACADLSFSRKTETSGTFVATGWAFTITAVDIPKEALQIVRENVSDANLPNLEVEETKIVPYLGPFDFLLDIIGVRYARISGTWGFTGT